MIDGAGHPLFVGPQKISVQNSSDRCIQDARIPDIKLCVSAHVILVKIRIHANRDEEVVPRICQVVGEEVTTLCLEGVSHLFHGRLPELRRNRGLIKAPDGSVQSCLIDFQLALAEWLHPMTYILPRSISRMLCRSQSFRVRRLSEFQQTTKKPPELSGGYFHQRLPFFVIAPECYGTARDPWCRYLPCRSQAALPAESSPYNSL